MVSLFDRLKLAVAVTSAARCFSSAGSRNLFVELSQEPRPTIFILARLLNPDASRTGGSFDAEGSTWWSRWVDGPENLVVKRMFFLSAPGVHSWYGEKEKKSNRWVGHIVVECIDPKHQNRLMLEAPWKHWNRISQRMRTGRHSLFSQEVNEQNHLVEVSFYRHWGASYYFAS